MFRTLQKIFAVPKEFLFNLSKIGGKIGKLNSSTMEGDDDLEPMDVLAYITEELQGGFRSAKNDKEKASIMDNFLRRWDAADPALDSLKKMNVEFEKDLDWFNVTQSLSMESLRGKLVILDFFTYCCINCMHVLPELHALEEHFSVERGLVVIGVHSPKFENEKDAVNILSAAQRYNITHAIVNDPNRSMWRAVGIRCWPTLLVLSPAGVPMLLCMGEGHGAFLQCFVDQALKYFERKQEIANFSLPLRPSTDLLPASNLCFPAKIARSSDGRFALADAGNNRVLIFDAQGVVLQKIGGCAVGFIDGDFALARFNSPQGIAFLNEDVLIVADTENHAIRQVTLSTGRVETLAGTGQQGHDRVGGKLGALQDISSPWDVAVFHKRDMDMSFHMDERNVPEKPIILVSMSGTHQIWGYFPEGMIWWKFRKFEPQICVAIVGNGIEENRNNSYPQNAAFAQPSGMAMAKDFLFIADSESSSIRKVSMVDGKVTAVVGGDRNPQNLFAFGDVDGKQYTAKLQHPLGVAYNHVTDKVYVADTYNHKIKVIDYASNSIETVPIKDATGALYHFNEPASLCFDANAEFLLVSDTNNHHIQIVNMKTLQAQRFNINFTQAGAITEIDAPQTGSLLRGGLKLIKSLPLSSYKSLKLRVEILLGDDLKFTAEAPQKWSLQTSNAVLQASSNAGQLNDAAFGLQFVRSNVPSTAATQQETKIDDIKFDIALSLCDAKCCLMKRFCLILSDSQTAATSTATDVVAEERIKLHITQNDIKFS